MKWEKHSFIKRSEWWVSIDIKTRYTGNGYNQCQGLEKNALILYAIQYTLKWEKHSLIKQSIHSFVKESG